jgi:hypothetical protein
MLGGQQRMRTLLLEDARRRLHQVERTKAGVQSCARGETGHIYLGFVGATYATATRR